MSKEICISSTPHETRLAILENDELTEIYYERENEYTLAGSIYKGRVTRVLPGMQSAFVDIGLERDAFLYVTDFMEEQEDGEEFERTSLSTSPPRRESGRGRQSQPEAAAPEASAPPASQESADDESPSGTRRWRGRRGRGRGVRRGSERENRNQNGQERSPAQIQEQSVEAGSEETVFDAPAIDVRVDKNEAAFERHTPAAAANRILLPGESLSRFGGKPADDTAPTAQASSAPTFKPSYVAPRPSTLIEVPITWDGSSSLLPGESRASQRGAPVPVPFDEPADEYAAEAEFEPATEAHTVAESSTAAAEEETAVTATEVSEPEVTAPAAVETLPEPVAQTTAPVAQPEPLHEVELHEEVQEFEPEDASAAHRVDTSTPSEFRIARTSEKEKEKKTSRRAPAVQEPVQEYASEHDEQAAEVPDHLFGFAPGTGILEEEVIDEDEYEFEPIHAHADEHDSEDMEEETLEHTSSEISDFVRDEHINQRLSSESAISEAEEAEADEEGHDFQISEVGLDEEDDIEEESAGEVPASADGATPSRERDRSGRRGGRRGDRSGSRLGGGRRQGRGGHRASAQTMDLPIISDLLKPGQEILLQIAKEPIAKKGARVTSHIALPGRFLVFMPTVNHVGVSRKIASDEVRQRLKRVLINEKGDASGGFIVRTAAEGAGEDELRADLRFLINLWNDIKQREEASKAPALIYHDLNLVERVLRDQVSDNFSTIWVDSEAEYERIVRFLNRFQPSLVRRAKLYTKETPLFEQFGIQEEITKALRSKVWLKSGGSIVINQTEALVAIDINTGKYVGKTARLEDTILKTNLDAIPEIVRQIRLRDLGGIIVIDFIDMDERKNRHKVMATLEEALKADRAPSKVLQFNDFGLVAITRKRVKQSLERTLGVPCPVCAATGMVKGPITVANEIYTELRKMYKHLDRGDIMLRVNPEVVKVLKANNARWLIELEELSGKTIIVKSDPALHPEQFDIH
ncbi:MAG TPA: Rne/Rng family ribonuclease [Acidobacteriaceae bacterium]|nr:Rne/Rng family ribonuclease [Acidobacteriaceae bacterium]